MPFFKKQPADPQLVQDQLAALRSVLAAYGPEFYMASFFWVNTKTEKKFSGAEKSLTVPFRANRVQRHLIKHMTNANRILKARQMGLTTFLLLYRLLLNVSTNTGRSGMLISQDNKYVELHFQIVSRALNLYGAQNPADASANDLNVSLKQHLLHTKYSNRRELLFDMLDSRLIVESAGKGEAGQGVTLHHLVCSEVARWPKTVNAMPEDVISNVLGGLVDDGTRDEESTANGAGGYFFDQCLLGMQRSKLSDATFHFYPWYWDDQYEAKITEKEKDELEKDLKTDEEALIKKMHSELAEVAWTGEMSGSIRRMYLGKIKWRRKTVLEQKRNFPEKFPESAEMAFLVSGKQFFDRDIVIARLMDLATYKPVASFSGGAAHIFKKRVPGRRYIIGMDPATGRTVTKEDTDFHAAVVLDLDTGEECASYRNRCSPDQAALDVADLGYYYNTCPIAVERTGDGQAVMQAMVSEAKYPIFYKFREWMRREKKFVELEGFPTTMKTRPVACNFLNRAVSTHPELIWDKQFLAEALVFVRDEKGKPAAATGAHDDTVSCRWIAHSARLHILGFWDPGHYASEVYISADQVVTA